jgi:hypothetical protein
MCEIIMLIFGIIALIRGRFLLTRVKEVHGWPARIIGILLIMPFPLSSLVALVLGAIFLAEGAEAGNSAIRQAVSIAGFAIVACCFLAAIGVAMFYAEPVRKKRPEQIEAALPDNYDERFQERGRDDSNSQDITGGSSRPPAPPDDRIQS